jgi:hypothetical protein
MITSPFGPYLLTGEWLAGKRGSVETLACRGGVVRLS